MNSDSAVPGLNRNSAHALKIKIPNSKQDIYAMSNILCSITSFKMAAIVTNKKLTQLRDTLLPKLMNGDLDVSEASAQ